MVDVATAPIDAEAAPRGSAAIAEALRPPSSDAANGEAAKSVQEPLATDPVAAGADQVTPPTSSPPDLSALSDLEPDVLIAANPKVRDLVAGLRGSQLQHEQWAKQEAERLATERITAREAELAEADRVRQRDEIRDTDPFAFAELDRQEKAAAQAQREREQAAAAQVTPLADQVKRYDETILAQIAGLPDDVRAPLNDKHYEGVEGRIEAIQDLARASQELGARSVREEYEAKIAELQNANMALAPRPAPASGLVPAITEDMSSLSPLDKLKRALDPRR